MCKNLSGRRCPRPLPSTSVRWTTRRKCILHECSEQKLATSHLSKFISHGSISRRLFKLPAVGFAVDGADVERVAVAVHRADDVFREGAAVGAEPVDECREVLHEPFKNLFSASLLMEPDVCVPVPVLYAGQQSRRNWYAGKCRRPACREYRVMFPRGVKLVVKSRSSTPYFFEAGPDGTASTGADGSVFPPC